MIQPVGKAGRCLERMPESVAEIELCALANLALVARHDRGLGATGGRNRMLARGTTCENIAVVGLEPGKKAVSYTHLTLPTIYSV